MQQSKAFMMKLPTQPSNCDGMPAMLSAAILPWRLARDPMGALFFNPLTWLSISMQSPAAYMSGSEVCIRLFTTIPPWGPTSRPASRARSLRGRTPTDMMTRSASIVRFGVITRQTLPVSSASMLVADSLVWIATLLSLRCFSSMAANAGSTIRGSSCSINSRTVVSIPQRSASDSAISRPMAPPPMTTALPTLPRARSFFMAMARCMSLTI